MSILSEAHDFVIINPQFISGAPKGTGLQELLRVSVPEARHDSSARYPPPLCHPGTRKNYIEKLLQWASDSDKHNVHIAWLKSAAGVGKSAIAQSCAEALKERLGAAFFFSRPNHRDDPDRLFTSIAHQLATSCSSYHDILDQKILLDPMLLKKSRPNQYHDLLIVPFHDHVVKEEVAGRVIIIDGLDECVDRQAQVDIIKIVAKSVQAQTTPFLWVFFTRLEPDLVATFNFPDIRSITLQIDLPISRDIDNEIFLYLTDKLTEIGYRHHLAVSWYTEEDAWTLVDLSAGLFIYAHTVVLFIDEEDSPGGPVDQLHVILQLAKHPITNISDHPLAGLNEFYKMIMERIPSKKLQRVQWIILATRMPRLYLWNVVDQANLLDLSESQFRDACRSLYSVMRIDEGLFIVLSHASFLDFLEDPARSGKFCIWSDPAATLLDKFLKKLDRIRVISTGGPSSHSDYTPRFDVHWPSSENHLRTGGWDHYTDLTLAFFTLLGSVRLPNEGQRLKAFIDFDFRKTCLRGRKLSGLQVSIDSLVQNIPHQSQLLRPCRAHNVIVTILHRIQPQEFWIRRYTIGRGGKKALLEVNADGDLWVVPYSRQSIAKLVSQLCEDSQRSAHLT